MNEQNASMDEILSSIRDIVKEEAGAQDAPAQQAEAAPAAEEAPAEDVANNDDIEAMMAAAAEEGDDTADDDVLELTETVDDANNQAAGEEMVDINAFAENGTETPADAAAVDAARAEYGEEGAEEAPAAMAEEIAEEPVVETPAPAAPKAAAPMAEAVAEKAEKVFLNAMPSAKGLQLAFPVEVLAEALRPLVKDWVSENLPDIVERLVREELSRLVDKK